MYSKIQLNSEDFIASLTCNEEVDNIAWALAGRLMSTSYSTKEHPPPPSIQMSGNKTILIVLVALMLPQSRHYRIKSSYQCN